MSVTGFIAWLNQFSEEDTPRGDLARDLLHDRVLRNARIDNFGVVQRRLPHKPLTVAYQAWLLYKQVPRTTLDEAQEILARAKELYPTLEPNGLDGTVRFFRDSDHYLDEIAACADWLGLQKRRKTLNTAAGSYNLKHRVEEACGRYISNGSLIAAAVALEIPGRRYERVDNPNMYFALSQTNALHPASNYPW